jgi:hypothetical protein
VLPDDIPAEAWNGWAAMRQKAGHPLTERASQLAVKELRKLAAEGHAPGDVLDQSTLRGWRGLFPIKKDTSNDNGSHQVHAARGRPSAHDAILTARARLAHLSE